MQYILSFAALSGAAIAATITTSPPAYPTYNPCIAVYENCVASGLTAYNGVNYAYCGAQSVACLKTAFPSTTSSTTSSKPTDNCSLVFESCVQSGLTIPGGPNFAYCGAQSASCLRTAYPSSSTSPLPYVTASATSSSKQLTTLAKPTTRPRESFPPPVYTTKTVSYYTTYCPSPTTVVVNPGTTITVTSATTLTITDCPCTITSQLPPPPPPPVVTVSPVSSGYAIVPSVTYSITNPIASVTTTPAGQTTYTGAAERSDANIVEMAAAVAAAAAFLI